MSNRIKGQGKSKTKKVLQLIVGAGKGRKCVSCGRPIDHIPYGYISCDPCADIGPGRGVRLTWSGQWQDGADWPKG
jgi:hypothetical protein